MTDPLSSNPVGASGGADAGGKMLVALADRVIAAKGFDNALDVACELALFEPAGGELAIRPNAAGTKVIVTYVGGRERTFIARDYTISAGARRKTADALYARARLSPPPVETIPRLMDLELFRDLDDEARRR